MRIFDKLFRVLAVVLFAHAMFVAGVRFADNEISEGTVNLVFAAFWLLILVMEWVMRGAEIKMLRRLEAATDELFTHLSKAVDAAQAEATAKKTRRKPAVKKPVAQKPVVKSKSQQRREAVVKGGKK